VLEDMVVEQAKTTKSVVGAIFEIPSAANIPSDNVAHRVTIGEIRNLEVKFSHVIHPSQVASAFLLVKTKNTSEMPIIEGPCAAFLDGNYISATRMPYTAIGAKCELFLGIDRDISVEYRAPFSVRDKTIPLLSSTQVERFTGAVIIKSSKASETTITMRHGAPFANDRNLKIVFTEPPISEEKKKVTVDDMEVSVKDSIITWEFPLKAGEEKKVNLAYSYEYPKNQFVISN